MGVIEAAAETAAESGAGGSVLPWALLGGVVVVIGAALAGYVYGHRAEEAAFNLYKSQQADAAEKQVAANKTALLVQQKSDAAALDKINQSHGVAINEITQRRDALLSANRNLSQRLWALTAGPSKQSTGVSQTGPGAGVDAQAGAVELSPVLGTWLVGRFTQADSNAALVTSLQAVVVHDREVCNGSIPGVTQASQ